MGEAEFTRVFFIGIVMGCFLGFLLSGYLWLHFCDKDRKPCWRAMVAIGKRLIGYKFTKHNLNAFNNTNNTNYDTVNVK